MSNNTLGGEVIMHPGPKHRNQGIKREHGSHDVKSGYGGNDVIIQKAPKLELDEAESHRGFHNTQVQGEPGNTVTMSRNGSAPLPPTPATPATPSGNQAEDAESLLDGSGDAEESITGSDVRL